MPVASARQFAIAMSRRPMAANNSYGRLIVVTNNAAAL
jgi:hypothetical protein